METRKVKHRYSKTPPATKLQNRNKTNSLTQVDLQFANGNTGMQRLHVNLRWMDQLLDRNHLHSYRVRLDKLNDFSPYLKHPKRLATIHSR